MKAKILFFTTLFFAFSCSNETAQEDAEANTTNQNELAEVAPSPPVEVLPILPNEKRLFFLENISGIEGTMYENGGSFSLPNPHNAKNFINFLKEEAPKQKTRNQVGHLLLLDQNKDQLSLLYVYRDNDVVYTQYIDEETKISYYNILTGQASDLFMNVQIQKVPTE